MFLFLLLPETFTVGNFVEFHTLLHPVIVMSFYGHNLLVGEDDNFDTGTVTGFLRLVGF
jgi:hypothetical protein